jgi:hypothetical protein
VTELFDTATKTWLDTHVDACAATHVRHEQSPALLDRRMACLRDWKRRFVALRDGFAKATPTMVGIATRAVAELPPVSRCSDVVGSRQDHRLDDPHRRSTTSRCRAREADLGEAADVLETAEKAVTEATTIGYEPTLINALLWKAEALTVLGKYDEARAAAKQCFDLALGIRDHRTASIASATIAFVGAFDSSKASESLDWVKTGESLRTKLENATTSPASSRTSRATSI